MVFPVCNVTTPGPDVPPYLRFVGSISTKSGDLRIPPRGGTRHVTFEKSGVAIICNYICPIK